MGRITSSTGLISGLPIATIVEQLMAIQAIPRDNLVLRNKQLSAQQTSLTEVTATLISVQVMVRNLAKADLYRQRSITSSDPSSLIATVNGTPSVGARQFTPIRTAQAHQLVSNALTSDTAPLGAGSLTFRFGGEIDEGLSLDLLNGGAGFARGKVRITDRSGASAEIDLRFARHVDDVLEAINNNTTIDVTASAVGDRFRLTDNTGQAVSNLKVQEVGGTTAASLGLAGINVAAAQATGTDVVRLFDAVPLDSLNNGTGVAFDETLSDLKVEFRDGSTTFVDLRPVSNALLPARATTTAANGINAQLTFTAESVGSSLAGVTVEFVDNAGITAGSETVAYNSSTKKLTFQIDAGNTTASHIAAALNNDATANAFFRASLPAGGNGSGIVDVADTAVTALPTTLPKETRLGDVLATLNSIAPGKLKAELSSDGDRIVLTDLTDDSGGTFKVSSVSGSKAAEHLGLTAASVGGTISGGRLLPGLKTSLVSKLNGTGLGELGALNLTDRSGATASVNLASAETLDDIITSINAAGLGILASVNPARNGIRLTDTTGQTTSNLIVANGDATNTATKLQLVTNAAATTKDSGSLHRQTVSGATLLATLNGGAGVRKGTIRVTNSNGNTYSVSLSSNSITTVGHVIQELNRAVTGIEARINETGDGILIVDTAGGPNTLKVEESGGKTAADLRLLGSAVSLTVGGVPAKGIDGTTTFKVTLDASNSLDDLITKINELAAGVTAAKINDGSTVAPYRLALQSTRSGRVGRLHVDTSQLNGLTFTESLRAQDALLLAGAPDDLVPGILSSSSTNTFTNALPGANVQVLKAASAPVTLAAQSVTTSLVTSIKTMVENYNRLRTKLSEATAFDAETNVSGPLLGDVAALRVDTELSRFLSGAFFGAGSFRSIEELGIHVKDDGKLEFNEATLTEKFAADPAAVEQFFSTKTNGFADKLDSLIEKLAGEDRSLLVNRLKSVSQKIGTHTDRIDLWDVRLERTKERLLRQYADLEQVIAQFQSSQQFISSIVAVKPISVGSRQN